jgi:hypothetical protein
MRAVEKKPILPGFGRIMGWQNHEEEGWLSKL